MPKDISSSKENDKKADRKAAGGPAFSSSSSTATASTTGGGGASNKPLLRACDQCWFRRVKCSHEQPCHHCRRLNVDCTYEKAAKGKRTSGKRIQELRGVVGMLGGEERKSGGVKSEDDTYHQPAGISLQQPTLPSSSSVLAASHYPPGPGLGTSSGSGMVMPLGGPPTYPPSSRNLGRPSPPERHLPPPFSHSHQPGPHGMNGPTLPPLAQMGIPAVGHHSHSPHHHHHHHHHGHSGSPYSGSAPAGYRSQQTPPYPSPRAGAGGGHLPPAPSATSSPSVESFPAAPLHHGPNPHVHNSQHSPVIEQHPSSSHGPQTITGAAAPYHRLSSRAPPTQHGAARAPWPMTSSEQQQRYKSTGGTSGTSPEYTRSPRSREDPHAYRSSHLPSPGGPSHPPHANAAVELSPRARPAPNMAYPPSQQHSFSAYSGPGGSSDAGGFGSSSGAEGIGLGMGMTMGGSGAGLQPPAFRLPDLDTSLADTFNAQDPATRGQFFDWSVMMEQAAAGAGVPAGAGAPNGNGNGKQMLGPPSGAEMDPNMIGNSAHQQQLGALLQPTGSGGEAGGEHAPGRRPSLNAAELFAIDMTGSAPTMFDSLSAPFANLAYANSHAGSADTPGSRASNVGGAGTGAAAGGLAAYPMGSNELLSNSTAPAPSSRNLLYGDPASALALLASEGNPLSDSVLIPRIATYFERLHPALPVFSRAWIFSRLDQGHQHSDENFASMLLAMSALVLIQPVEGKEKASIKSRMEHAQHLLDECVRLRNQVLFGKVPTLDSAMTSFYMFACLFGMREDNAAWFRLHEAVCVGHLLKLHVPSAYESLERDEQERFLRCYWLLSLTERAYALQRGHSLGFRGHPASHTKHLRKRFKLDEFDDFPNLQLKLFDSVDEDFVDCWNGRCAGRTCRKLNADKAAKLYHSFMEDYDQQDEQPESVPTPQIAASEEGTGESEYERKKVQKADVNVTRQWLLNRLWLTCLSHGLVSVDSQHAPLQATHAVDIARRTLKIVERLTMPAMEAHGIGFAEKLYDIAMTLIVIYKDFPSVIESAQAQEEQRQQQKPAAVGLSPQTPIFGQKDLTSIHFILQAYVEFLRVFRHGEHPFLGKLIDQIKELPQQQHDIFDTFLQQLGVF